MSYNIDSIEIIASDGFRISRAKYDELKEAFEDSEKLPESSCFDDDWVTVCTKEVGDHIYPKHFWWQGEFSGRTHETLYDEVLPQFEGEADLVLIWEGGDGINGLRLRDGKVTEHEVVQTLGKEIQR
jgi:hypothetical protein